MRLDLTPDEVELVAQLCEGCDDADDVVKRLAARVARYFRRELAHAAKRHAEGKDA